MRFQSSPSVYFHSRLLSALKTQLRKDVLNLMFWLDRTGSTEGWGSAIFLCICGSTPTFITLYIIRWLSHSLNHKLSLLNLGVQVLRRFLFQADITMLFFWGRSGRTFLRFRSWSFFFLLFILSCESFDDIRSILLVNNFFALISHFLDNLGSSFDKSINSLSNSFSRYESKF